MNKQQQKEAWHRQELNLFEARKSGFTSIRRRTRKGSVEVPVVQAQAKNNAWHDAMRRGGSYGCTVNRIA
jgi:hypothetical protein